MKIVAVSNAFVISEFHAGGGTPLMKGVGMLVGNFELNP